MKSDGRIYQVWDRQNDLDTLLCDRRLTRQGTELVRQVAAIVARGYRRVARYYGKHARPKSFAPHNGLCRS
jgi:hypothetical protein